MTDLELRQKGASVLLQNLGSVEAQRFITLLLREPFDYTEWCKPLFAGHTIEEISSAAMANRTMLADE